MSIVTKVWINLCFSIIAGSLMVLNDIAAPEVQESSSTVIDRWDPSTGTIIRDNR